MDVKVPSDTDVPLTLSTENDVQRLELLNQIGTFAAEGKLEELVFVQEQLARWLSAVGHYDYLTPGEWEAYVAASDAVHLGTTTQITAIVRTGAEDDLLKSLFPQFKGYGKVDWAALLEADPTDEDRLFKEFYPPNLDVESDNSDEEDDDFARRTTRTAVAQQRRKKNRKRRPTSRTDQIHNPDAMQLKARMEKMSAGFGRAFGQDLSKLTLPAAKPPPKAKGKRGKDADDEPPVDKAADEKPKDDKAKDDTPPPPVSGLAELLAQAQKNKASLNARNEAQYALQSWILEQYRAERLAGTWNGPAPASIDALRDSLRVHLKDLDDEERTGKMAELEGDLKTKESKASGYTLPLKSLFDTVRGKMSYGRPEMVKGNAEILYPPRTLTTEVLEELAGVNDDLARKKAVRKNRFVIAQYRGISYDLDKFRAVSRRKSRESVELLLPVYASAVFDVVKINPGDYYAGLYVKDDTVTAQLAFEAERLKKELVRKRKSGKIELSSAARDVLREWSPAGPKGAAKGPVKDPYNGKLKKDQVGPLRYGNAAYALQNFYTINYGGFFGLLRYHLSQTTRAQAQSKGASVALLPKPEALTPEDDLVFAGIYGGLRSGGNPFASSGKSPRHALRYAYGIKYYTGADAKLKLRPDWTPGGRPSHPYAGKVYVSLHPLEDFTGEDGPLDVVALNVAGELDVPADILGEREAAFPALIPEKRIAIEHVARYPSLNGQYKKAYLQKYGLTRDEWQAYRSLVEVAVSDSQRDKIYEAMSEWMVRFHEARLVELARRLAEQQEKILVYRNDDGLLELGKEATEGSIVEAIRSSSDAPSDEITLGKPAKLDFESRALFGGEPLEPREPVKVVGIINSGNDCYLSSVLQMLAVLDPATTYEMAGGKRDDNDLALSLLAFRTVLRDDATDATYLGRWPWVYTNQDQADLRLKIATTRGWQRLYGQQDASEALETLLGAFDRSPEVNFTSEGLEQMSGEVFAEVRPSKLHVRRKIVRTYDTSAGGQAEAVGGASELDAESTRTTYDTVNLFQFFFQVPAAVKKDALEEESHSLVADKPKGVDEPKSMAEPKSADEPIADEEPEPVHLEALLARYTSTELDPGDTDTIRARKGDLYYPAAPLLKETVSLMEDPRAALIQLKRFTDPEHKNEAPVIVPEALWGLHLQAAIVHHGGSLGAGHYTSYVKVEDTWYHVNDDYVTELEDYPAKALQGGYLFYYS